MQRLHQHSFDCTGTLYYEVEEDYVVFHRILHSLGYDFEVADVKEALNDARMWCNSEKTKTREVWTESSWAKLLQRMALKSCNSKYGFGRRALHQQWLLEADFKAYEDAVPTYK